MVSTSALATLAGIMAREEKEIAAITRERWVLDQ